MLQIFIDADGCPVKEEVYRVARRCGLGVKVVANSFMAVPEDPSMERVVVGQGFDEADDWIAERVGAGDIVVTTDIPLAARCVRAGAAALSPKGKVFTEASMGDVLATRELMALMREHGTMMGGPAPFSKRDRSLFLQRLDDLAQAALRMSQRRE